MDDWETIEQDLKRCSQCELGKSRTNVVIGRGGVNAPLLLVGEGPGQQEDLQGKPFVGAAGRLLDLLLDSLQITEDLFYIANIVKCRPPENRVPTDEEAEKCMPFLRRQVKLIKPFVIVCMGNTATRYLIGKEYNRISEIRGKWFRKGGFDIMPTFHPAALLRDPKKKAYMFDDLKSAAEKLKELGF